MIERTTLKKSDLPEQAGLLEARLRGCLEVVMELRTLATNKTHST